MTHEEGFNNRWTAARLQQLETEEFSTERLSADRVNVVYSDVGGTMPGVVEVRVAGAFDTVGDFLGWLRYSEIVRALDHNEGREYSQTGSVEECLAGLDGELRDSAEAALQALDEALAADSPTPEQVKAAVSAFNVALANTNPTLEVLAYGSLADVVTTPDVEEALRELLEEDSEAAGALLALLDGDSFDESDDKHAMIAVAALGEIEILG